MTGARLRSLETDWLWATVSQVLVVEHDAQDPSCRGGVAGVHRGCPQVFFEALHFPKNRLILDPYHTKIVQILWVIMFGEIVPFNGLHNKFVTVQIIDPFAGYDQAFVYFQTREIIEFSCFLGVLHSAGSLDGLRSGQVGITGLGVLAIIR
jgi:hypothetical protein